MVGYKIYFYPKSFEKAMRQIDKAKIDLLAKCELFMRRVGEIGRGTAQWSFGNSIDVSTILINEGDTIGVLITADGKGVTFLEFGAGLGVGKPYNPLEANAPFPVYAGSWSTTHAHQFERNGYWYFGGRVYKAVTPRRGMYKAYKEITDRMYIIADEVFNG